MDDQANFRDTDSIPPEDVAIRLPIDYDPARLIKDLESQMKEAAKQLEFERAAALRDEVVQLRGIQVLEKGPEGAFAAEPKTTKRVVRRRRGI